MKPTLTFLADLTKIVFREKWESIGAVLTAVVSLFTLPVPWAILIGLFAVALLIDLIIFIRTTARDLREKHIPLLVIVGRDDDDLERMEDLVEKTMAPLGYKSREWDALYDLELKDLTIWRKSLLPARSETWHAMVNQFEKKISRINNHPRLIGRKIYHVFIYGPSALAAGLGAICGTKTCFVLHHFDPHTDSYLAKIDFSSNKTSNGLGPRAIKEPLHPPYHYIQTQAPDDPGERLYAIIHLSTLAHDPSPAVLQKAQSTNASVAIISSTYGGILKPEDNWLHVAREVIDALSRYITDQRVQEIELFLNCPVPMAFAIGMAIGILSPVTVNNWFADQNTYYPVIQLNKLKPTF